MKKALLSLLFTAFLSAAGAASASHAETARSDQNRIYQVKTAKGIVSAIEFPAGDQVLHYASGVSSAFEFSARGNVLLLKPKVPEAASNLFVATGRGTWLFDLEESPQETATYRLLLTPSEKERQAAETAAHEKEILEKRLADDLAGFRPPARLCRDYTANFGENPKSLRLAPVSAADNGVFTRLVFRAGTEFPAVYEVTPEGESIAAWHRAGDGSLILHGVFEELRLRLGSAVAGIYRGSCGNAADAPFAPASGAAPGLVRLRQSSERKTAP